MAEAQPLFSGADPMPRAAPISAGFGDVDQLARRPGPEALGGHNAAPRWIPPRLVGLPAFGTAPDPGASWVMIWIVRLGQNDGSTRT